MYRRRTRRRCWARKGEGQAVKLSFAGHVLMENRNGLVVDVVLSDDAGAGPHRTEGITVGADKGYDTGEFVTTLPLVPDHASRGQGTQP